jgi:hypothetical protein
MAVHTPATGNHQGDGYADRHDSSHSRGSDAGTEGGAHQRATDLLKHVLDKDPKLTFVIIEEVELDNWGVAGLTTPEYRQQVAGQSPG